MNAQLENIVQPAQLLLKLVISVLITHSLVRLPKQTVCLAKKVTLVAKEASTILQEDAPLDSIVQILQGQICNSHAKKVTTVPRDPKIN